MHLIITNFFHGAGGLGTRKPLTPADRYAGYRGITSECDDLRCLLDAPTPDIKSNALRREQRESAKLVDTQNPRPEIPSTRGDGQTPSRERRAQCQEQERVAPQNRGYCRITSRDEGRNDLGWRD